MSITGEIARREVYLMRAEADGILVGIGTALEDDPALTVRLPGLENRSPARIVLDRQLRLPETSKWFQAWTVCRSISPLAWRPTRNGVPRWNAPGRA